MDLYRTRELPIHTIWDVGANIGSITLYLYKYFKHSEIYAFEPIGNTYRILKENVRKKQNIITCPFALGDQNKEVVIALHEEHTINSLKRTSITQGAKTETIQVRKGDTLILNNTCKPPDLLKIDVEGFEIEVLDGLSLALDEVKAVFIEVGLKPSDRFHTHIKDVLAYMEKRDFVLTSFYERGKNPNQKIVCYYTNLLFIKNKYIKTY